MELSEVEKMEKKKLTYEQRRERNRKARERYHRKKEEEQKAIWEKNKEGIRKAKAENRFGDWF